MCFIKIDFDLVILGVLNIAAILNTLQLVPLFVQVFIFSFCYDWLHFVLRRSRECVNLTIYDPTIVTNIVCSSGNDKLAAPSLFCFPRPAVQLSLSC